MEKFALSFGGGPGRRGLLETVEAQKRQLLQYQARLADVVRAYKSLLKEKAALEASLKVLSAAPESGAGAGAGPADAGAHDRSCARSGDAAAGSGGAQGELGTEAETPAAAAPLLKPEEASGGDVPAAGGEADKRGLQLKTQLATLTSSLATVTQEKSRMEASYQAEKKKMKQDLDEASRKAEEERSKLEAEMKRVQEQLAETKARLITQQHDRAQEQSDHALMLRELQRLLQSERTLRQDAELKLEETREALAGRVYMADRVEEYELQIKQLSRVVEELKRELQAVQEENSKPDPRLQQLQDEMASLKSHFQAQLLQEMRKTAQAEEQLCQHAQMEEHRVASLESQVSEVSELLGTYEKAKQKDQMTIQKLKDRIVQLDLENKTLAIAASSRSPMDIHMEEASLDVNVLKDKMEKLKKLLQMAVKKSQPALDIEKLCELELPKGTEAGDGEKATALYYQQELKQLKEEFERYKMRAQVVLKNKSAKDGNLAKELEDTQEQLAELKEKYIALRLSCEEMEKQHRQEMEAKKQEASHLQQVHRQKLEKCQLDYREKTLKLEEEMHKQRDRALAVLSEKDQELEQLRSVAIPYGLQGSKNYPAPGSDNSSDDLMGAISSDNLTQALHLAAANEPTFFLYAEQLARKEVEIVALRKQKHKLEKEVHQLQERLLVEGETHREEVSTLQDHIQKNLRDKNREGANLEYLKNIVYRFLTLPDSLGRQQTLTAILTILHFSPEEKHAVMRHSANSSWWLSGKR